ncbi:ankyrin repeat domain-containing protein [Aspergillus mulundensis]|uniref:Uncharacterized protein n=1 Tax=Aspergillus mulundensis TaxID=1810919 RepID=A0A3D8S5H9_9EURO|nr:hypothetical protein DSM5745_05063 [Aspergillus mulundensis]RDW81506.1 hypothetical protein DSM5745_05063 [Aspergillus mulundensis]
MPYADLPVEIILNIASFFDLDFDVQPDNWGPSTYHADVKSLSNWIQTSKWHASVLTPVLYDSAFGFTVEQSTANTAPALDESAFGFTVEQSTANTAPALDESASGFTPMQNTADTALVSFRSRAMLKNSRRIWAVGQVWESKQITDYFLSRTDKWFPCAGYDPERLSILAAMVHAKDHGLLKILLSQEDIRKTQLEPSDLAQYTPLRVAIEIIDKRAVQLLLGARASLTHRDHLGYSALHHAAIVDASRRWQEYRCETVEILEILLAAGADVWATANGSHTPLPIHCALKSFDLQRAERLLEVMLATADQASKGNWKYSILLFALGKVNSNVTGLVQTLLKNGADIFTSTCERDTALGLIGHWRPYFDDGWGLSEVKAQGRELATRLFQTNPRIWPKGHINRQLWKHVQEGPVLKCHLILFDLLLKSGGSALTAVGNDGNTPLHYLCDPSFMSGLDSYNYKGRFKNTLRMIALLLDNGASISAQNSKGQTPLFLAARSPWPQFLALLLRKRPMDPAVNTAETRGETPLRVVVGRGNTELVKLLIDNGADLNAIDNRGSSVVHIAATAKSKILHWLIQAGCDLSPIHSSDGSALHIAITYGFIRGVRALLDAGCSPFVTNSDGRTALRLAAACGKFSILHELVRREGRKLVEADDQGSGSLVCALLGVNWETWAGCSKNSAKKAARLLVANGAAVHDQCPTCAVGRKHCRLSS